MSPTEILTEPVISDIPEQNQSIFQGVGVIVGKVNLREEGKLSITIGDYEYPLFYIPQRRRAFDALIKEIGSNGNSNQRLVVYPQIIHLPRRGSGEAGGRGQGVEGKISSPLLPAPCPPASSPLRPAPRPIAFSRPSYKVGFQLVAFDRGEPQPNSVSSTLEDMEFRLSGLWQFIPICRIPCISIYRNSSTERLRKVKESDSSRNVKFMKPIHVPVSWKDSPIQPFRYNKAEAKAGKVGHPMFVTIKAKFLPGKDVFEFVDLLAPPQKNPPGFLRASNKDKAIALTEARNRKNAETR